MTLEGRILLSRVEFRCADEWAKSLAEMNGAGETEAWRSALIETEAWRSALITVRVLLMGLDPRTVPARPPLSELTWQQRVVILRGQLALIRQRAERGMIDVSSIIRAEELVRGLQARET
jgi:hypothetical protein